jgi:hypothetical protein
VTSARAGLVVLLLFLASADPFGANPDEMCQIFSVRRTGGGLRQLTRLPVDTVRERRAVGCLTAGVEGDRCGITGVVQDPKTGSLLFLSSCDPLGTNPFGAQFFTMAPDGSGLRQITATRRMVVAPDGSLSVEAPGPVSYSGRLGG